MNPNIVNIEFFCERRYYALANTVNTLYSIHGIASVNTLYSIHGIAFIVVKTDCSLERPESLDRPWIVAVFERPFGKLFQKNKKLTYVRRYPTYDSWCFLAFRIHLAAWSNPSIQILHRYIQQLVIRKIPEIRTSGIREIGTRDLFIIRIFLYPWHEVVR